MRFTSRSRAPLLLSLSKQRMVPSQRRSRIGSPRDEARCTERRVYDHATRLEEGGSLDGSACKSPNATSEPNSYSEEGYIPMKSTDKAVELSAQTTRNVFKRNSVLFAAVLLAALAGLVAFPDATVADAPQRHDQVPGFYRLKVGDLEVTALFDGPGVFDVNWVNGQKTKDGVLKALQDDPHLLDIADAGYLVNIGKQLILVDAGSGTWFGGGKFGRLLPKFGVNFTVILQIWPKIEHSSTSCLQQLMNFGKRSLIPPAVLAYERDGGFSLPSLGSRVS